MASKTFGDKVAVDATDLAGRSFGSETNDCRSDVDEAIEALEKKTGLAKVDWINGASITAAGGDIELQGRDLLAGQTFDELDVDSTHGLIFTALKPGDSELTVELVSGGATAVAKVGNAITITFNAGTDDDDAIATAVNANAAATDGFLRAASSGSINAAGIVSAGAFGPSPLIGGVGAGFVCRVSGVECLPANTTGTAGAAAITDTQADVTVPNLTAESPARAAGEFVGINIESDGLVSGSITAPLA